MSSKSKRSAKTSKKSSSTKRRDKDKGHPLNHRNKRRAREDEGGPPPRIVVTVGHGHPKVEPDTYDAAALLKSVLAAVEPRLEEGLAALAETARTAGGPEAGAEAARAVRAVGHQIADALRAGVVEGMRTRERHLAQLAVIDRAAAQASSLSSLQARISAEIEHAGLRRISDLSDLSPFNLASSNGAAPARPDGGQEYELVTPAYVEAGSGRLVERGWVKVAEPAPPPGGKAHGRVSRAHHSKRRAKDDEGTSPGEADKPGEQSLPVPTNGVKRQEPAQPPQPDNTEPPADEQPREKPRGEEPSLHGASPVPEPERGKNTAASQASSITQPAAPPQQNATERPAQATKPRQDAAERPAQATPPLARVENRTAVRRGGRRRQSQPPAPGAIPGERSKTNEQPLRRRR